MHTENLIIGAGLSGLYLAYKLEQQGKDYLILEARDRLGGRIHDHDGLDLGPTWFWPGQRRMTALANELGINIFEQQTQGDLLYEDPTVQSERLPGQNYQMTSYRMEGGISELIKGLSRAIPSEKILTGHCVNKISNVRERLEVSYSTENSVQPFTTKRIHFALPPRLVSKSISFEPDLPKQTQDDMLSIPTWMAGQAKALIHFDKPFWRDRNLSGQAFSRLGPLMEIHDASASSTGPYALFGFIGGNGQQRKDIGEEQLKEAIAQQIKRLYGPDSPSPIDIIIKDWSQDHFTATEEDMEPLQSHPTYGLPASLSNLWEGRISFIGTEVAKSEGGYLEGALVAAEDVLEKLN